MTTSTVTVHEAITTAAAAGPPAPALGGDPAAGVLGGLGALAGVSPVLAGAYLAYLVIRMLIPAVLILCTIRVVPASQRSALLYTYLGTTPGSSARRSSRPPRSPLARSEPRDCRSGLRHA